MKGKKEELSEGERKDLDKKIEKIKDIDYSDEARSATKKFNEAMNDNEIKYERIFQTFGHVEDDPDHGPACGHCVQQKEVFEKIKEKNDKVKIEEYSIYKDELGQQAFQKKKVKVIPTTFDCPIDQETGKVKEDECVEIQGYNENYFKKYLDPLSEE